jgi:hypothetical protein
MPLAAIRRQLKAIINQAFNQQGQDIHAYLATKTFFSRYNRQSSQPG